MEHEKVLFNRAAHGDRGGTRAIVQLSGREYQGERLLGGDDVATGENPITQSLGRNHRCIRLNR